jgi:hypothetical protein
MITISDIWSFPMWQIFGMIEDDMILQLSQEFDDEKRRNRDEMREDREESEMPIIKIELFLRFVDPSKARSSGRSRRSRCEYDTLNCVDNAKRNLDSILPVGRKL